MRSVPKLQEVTFNSNGGSEVATVNITSGSAITAPTAPTREGYTFIGWYKEAALENAWDFAADKVTANITLYAKWTKNEEKPDTYTVTVNDSYATNTGVGRYTQGAMVTIDAGSRSNYSFVGWTTAPEAIALVSASSAVTTFIMPAGDVTVTANWIYNPLSNPDPDPNTPITTPTPSAPTPVFEIKVTDGQIITTIPVKPTADKDGKAVAAISETQEITDLFLQSTSFNTIMM